MSAARYTLGTYRLDVDLVVGRHGELARALLVRAVVLAPRRRAERLCTHHITLTTTTSLLHYNIGFLSHALRFI